jgi:hypothetical protein
MQVEAAILGLAEDSRWNEQAKGDGNDQIDEFRRLKKTNQNSSLGLMQTERDRSVFFFFIVFSWSTG